MGTQVKIGKLTVPANASIIAEDLHLEESSVQSQTNVMAA
jgi:hypothetical protein